MPIGYGQCKGRKYNNVQRLPEEEKQQKTMFKTCVKCGEKKPRTEFATKRFCNTCMDEIESNYMFENLGGD